jgi:thiol-disulfide isomerase/thioredoxin
MKENTFSFAELENLLKQENTSALYFTSPGCGVCHTLKPKLEAMLQAEFPLIQFIEINIPDHPEITGQHRVFTSPTLLVFFDGKEYLRSVRNMGVTQIMEKLKRPYLLLTS